MPRARKRPILTAPLGPEGRKRLAERVSEIQRRGTEARERVAASTGGKPGRADAQRLAKAAARPDPLERRIAKAEANAEHLANLGNRMDAARAERTAAALKAKLAKQRRAESVERERADARVCRLDRFALLVQRSGILTETHYRLADLWLAALDAAADGEMARPAQAGGTAEDAAVGAPSGPAMFLRGTSVLNRWKTAVPVEAVASGRRSLPPVFDPKRVKAVRAAPSGNGPALPEACHQRRSRAQKLMDMFVNGITEAGHPEWCVPVAIRVILKNQGLRDAMTALGIGYGDKNRDEAQSAMAAGLLALGPAVDRSSV